MYRNICNRVFTFFLLLLSNFYTIRTLILYSCPLRHILKKLYNSIVYTTVKWLLWTIKYIAKILNTTVHSNGIWLALSILVLVSFSVLCWWSPHVYVQTIIRWLPSLNLKTIENEEFVFYNLCLYKFWKIKPSELSQVTTCM